MAQEILCAIGGEPLLEGTWAGVIRWNHPEDTPLYESFLWRVEWRQGKLVLVAQDTYQVLPITEDVAGHLGVIHPSRVVSILDYPSQWQAWRADGWGVYFMDTFDDGIMICAHGKRLFYTNRISGEDVAECLRTPGGMEELLMANLHSANESGQRKHVSQSSMASPKITQNQTPLAKSTPASCLHTVAFNDLEDTFFGAPGTPDRTEYDAALELAMIPSAIKAYRQQHNLTQAELGERVGVQKAQISELEHNASNATLDTLRKVFGAMQTVVKIQLVPQTQ
jgi:HTH-type transcriptional regulator/antitoxin HipB